MQPPLLTLLAWRNLWRHKRRTLVMLSALGLGVWSMIVLAAIVRGSMEQQITKEILNLTGHVQIHATGYRDDPSVDRRFTVSAPLRAALQGRDIIAASARVRVPAVISSERDSAGVTLVGIDPDGERGLSFIPAAVTRGRYLSAPDDNGVLLGRKLAEQLETAVGRRIVLMSQDANNRVADRGFRVVGIFETQPRSMESGTVFVGLAVARKMLRIGDDVSEVAVMTPDRNALQPPLAALRAAAPDLDTAPWTEVQPLLVLTEKINNVVLIIWFGVVFAAMAFGLVNTLLMAVFERLREFGLFQALGMSPRFILGQVLVESLLLLLVSLVVGNALGLACVAALHGGIDLSAFAEGLELVGVAPVLYPRLAVADIALANVIVVVFGVLASLYPAWRASRHVPIDAITRA